MCTNTNTRMMHLHRKKKKAPSQVPPNNQVKPLGASFGQSLYQRVSWCKVMGARCDGVWERLFVRTGDANVQKVLCDHSRQWQSVCDGWGLGCVCVCDGGGKWEANPFRSIRS